MPKLNLEEMHSRLQTFVTRIRTGANIPKEELHEAVNIASDLLENNVCASPIELDNLAATLLRCAAAQGDLNMVQLLLQQKPSLLALVDAEKGMTALHFAAKYGHINVVEWLFQVDTENVAQLDSDEHNVLFYAVQSENLELLEWFLKNRRSDFYHYDNDDGVPLNVAAFEGTFEVFKWFVEKSPRETINRAGELLLINCVYSGSLEKVKWLLKQNLVRIPRNILMLALGAGDELKIFTYLVDCYPDMLLLSTNNDGRTPFHRIAEDGDSDLFFLMRAKALEKSGRNTVNIDNIEDNEGCIPLFDAIKNGHFLLAKRLINETEVDLLHKNRKGQNSTSFCRNAQLNAIKKIEDLKAEFTDKVASEEENEELRQLQFEAEEISKLKYYLFSEIERRGLSAEGFSEGHKNELVKQKQKYLQYCTAVFKETRAFLDKNSAYITLGYFSEDLECYLNSQEAQDLFMPKLPIKSDRTPVEEVEEQQAIKPKRENDSELEEKQPKRSKYCLFSENTQNSKSEFQDPKPGPSL